MAEVKEEEYNKNYDIFIGGFLNYTLRNFPHNRQLKLSIENA